MRVQWGVGGDEDRDVDKGRVTVMENFEWEEKLDINKEGQCRNVKRRGDLKQQE